jgi:hypothetical protein
MSIGYQKAQKKSTWNATSSAKTAAFVEADSTKG